MNNEVDRILQAQNIKPSQVAGNRNRTKAVKKEKNKKRKAVKDVNTKQAYARFIQGLNV